MARERLTDLTSDIDLQNETTKRRRKTGLHQHGRNFIAESAQDVSKIKEGDQVRNISPKQCRIFKYNDREYDLLNKDRVGDLISSFKDPAIGQLEPVIARIDPTGKSEYEVIAGTRRLFAATWLAENTSMDFKLKAIVREMTDLEALQIMRIENDASEPPSPYERAFSTTAQIKDMFNGNASEYCQAMNEPLSSVNDLLAFTQIPEECLDAYASKLDIPINHAVRIRSELKNSEGEGAYKKAMLAEAKRLSSERDIVEPSKVLKALIEAGKAATRTEKKLEKEVTRKYAVGKNKAGVEAKISKTRLTTIRISKDCWDNKEAAMAAINKFMTEAYGS
ncbi:MAG: ParB/RepB/Spo0J family partition protein [Gammaproteobacteria bacterium]|nr:ParB/RepB/Spo0J family partition protein [Gammaproteobacteria bacterium]